MRARAIARYFIHYIFPLSLLGGVFYVLWVGLSLDPHHPIDSEPLDRVLKEREAYPILDRNQSKCFEKLLKEFRCIMCQNQSLADSSAPVALQIKKAIHIQVSEGKTEDQIKAFLVARYGDYILYNPPFKKETFLLWLGPLCFFFIATGVGWKSFRKHPT